MKHLPYYTAALCLTLLLAGCSQKVSSGTPDGIIPQTLKAEVLLPERIEPQHETPLSVKITDESAQPDAQAKVSIELWRSGKPEDKKQFQPEALGDGLFRIFTSFDNDGVYLIRTVVSHNEQTIMPVQRFIVGKPSDAELRQHLQIEAKPPAEPAGAHHEH